jgi:hypothetical protein
MRQNCLAGGRMAKKKETKIMLAEHILELRHVPSGAFLDVRGYVADFIKNSGLFPHWKIDSNVVNFRDKSDGPEREGAFIGYKSVGYVVYNAETRNYFVDRAVSFWKASLKNEHYNIPAITRFGARTKVFIPSPLSFDEINKTVFEGFFTAKARELVGGREKDVQFVLNLVEKQFEVRVRGGPVHKGEVGSYLNFESADFEKCGLFLDLDYFKTEDISHEHVGMLLKEAIDLTWLKIERIASGLGL